MGGVVGYVGKPREHTAQDRLFAEADLQWYFQEAEYLFDDLVRSFGVGGFQDPVGQADRRHRNYGRYCGVRKRLDRIEVKHRRVLALRFNPDDRGASFYHEWVRDFGDLAGIVRAMGERPTSKADRTARKLEARALYRQAVDAYLGAAWES